LSCRAIRALTDLRVQIRAETHLVEATDRLIAAVERHRVDFVVFNDHLAEGVEMAGGNMARFEHWARRLGRSADDLLAAIRRAGAEAPRVPRSLPTLAEAFDRLGVTYGSHDDPDGETRERFRALGAVVAEFPLRLSVAAAAQASPRRC
jgi:alpha-D-ribose 1-methylphosphonate 5-triphosphate diphosphatase